MNIVEHRRTEQITRILDLTIRERKSVKDACGIVGIDESTWYRWSKEGYIQEFLQATSAEAVQRVYDLILPNFDSIIGNLVSIAKGQAPEGTEMKINANHMLKAISQILEIIPPGRIDQAAAGGGPSQHLQNYQPQQINVAGNAEFIYSGDADHPAMGRMDTSDLRIEGDYEEVEDDS